MCSYKISLNNQGSIDCLTKPAETLFPSSLKYVCSVVFQGAVENKAESAGLTHLVGPKLDTAEGLVCDLF